MKMRCAGKSWADSAVIEVATPHKREFSFIPMYPIFKKYIPPFPLRNTRKLTKNPLKKEKTFPTIHHGYKNRNGSYIFLINMINDQYVINILMTLLFNILMIITFTQISSLIIYIY